MNPLLSVLLIFFAAGIVGFMATCQAVADFLQNYRNYFIKKVGPGLRQSHVLADLTVLFGASLGLICLLLILGYFLLGVPGALLGVVLGVLVPKFALNTIKKRRTQRFILQLPDALYALSSTLRSGVNLPKGLEQLASWQPAPLSQEFNTVLTEYQIGRELGEALENMRTRIDRSEVELLIGAINISRSVGGNLADTLESLAETLTEKITVEGKIQALTAMGRMQGWVVSAVPLLVGIAMYLSNPEQIMPLFTELNGWITLAVIATMMTMAVFSIRRIVNIDV